MPALPAVPNVIRAVFNLTIGADTSAMVRLYFAYSGSPPTSSDLNSIAGTFSSAWNTNLISIHPSQVVLTSVVLTDLNTLSGAGGINSTARTGTLAGTPLPASVAGMFGGQVARRYRGGKPRTFLPCGVTASTGNSQRWSGTFITTATTAINNFITACIGATSGATTISSHVNVSYYQGFTNVTSPTTGRARTVPKLRAGGPITDVVTTMALAPIIGTQRRRLGR